MINTTMLDIINDIINDVVSDIVIDHIAEDSTRDFYDSPSQVIFNPPATIVIFNDGTKIISKCDKEDKFSKETGFLMCMLKKNYGNIIAHKMLEEFVYSKERSVKENVKKVPKSKKIK